MRYILLFLLSTAYAEICDEDQYVDSSYISNTLKYEGTGCGGTVDCETQCSVDASCDGYSQSTLSASSSEDMIVGNGYGLVITYSGTLSYFGSDSYGISSLAGAQNVQDMDAFSNHACILVAGEKICAGSSSNGRLGDPLSGIAQISTGDAHTCARMSDGTVKCWGKGEGRLGNGGTSSTSAPQTVIDTSDAALSGVTSVSSGGEDSCALIGTAAYCWGKNSKCGIINQGYSWGSCSQVTKAKQAYTSVLNFAIDVGHQFSCSIDTSKNVWCQGYNLFGKVGKGGNYGQDGGWYTDSIAVKTYTSPQQLSLSNIRQISLGNHHACAVNENDEAFCWGYNGDGRFGNGQTSNAVTTPVQVGTGVQSVTCGSNSVCFKSTAGVLECYGEVNPYISGGNLKTSPKFNFTVTGAETFHEYGPLVSGTAVSYIKSISCQSCPTGTTNEAGDDTALGSTTCETCTANYKVDSGACVDCPTNPVTTTNEAGDPITGGDTYCDLAEGYVSSGGTDVPDQCAVNYKVESGACVECAPGKTNAAGDPLSGGDTSCDAITCSENHHVVSNVCTLCGPEYLHPAGDDASGGDTQCTSCNTNYKVEGGSCVACLPSFSNVAGDPVSGGDTYCDCPPYSTFNEATNKCECAENYFVNLNNECQYCGMGLFNDAGDDPAGGETGCSQKICAENEHVQGDECLPCPVGTTNPAGDATAQGDSQCTPDFCDLNQYVSGNTCLDCDPGYGNPAGDPTSGPDTSCSFIPCAQNHHMSGGLCVACPSGAVRAAGDSDPSIDTSCKCPIDHHVSTGTCQVCPAGSTNAPGDDPSGSDTQCQFKVCGKNEYASGSQCLKCASGLYNDPGDSVEFNTTCDDTQICDNDQYADGTQCLPCPAGESNPAGDLATTVTSCTTDLCTTCCAMNEHVVNGACQACPDGLTNIAGDNPLAGNTDCDDVVCEENFFAVGDGECDRCPEGSFNLAGDIAKEGFTIKPATSCCPAGQFEHMVDLSLGTRECRDCSEIRERFNMLNCCRGTDLSGQVSQLCDRLLDYYKKVCQPLESADVCPVQNYV